MQKSIFIYLQIQQEPHIFTWLFHEGIPQKKNTVKVLHRICGDSQIPLASVGLEPSARDFLKYIFNYSSKVTPFFFSKEDNL